MLKLKYTLERNEKEAIDAIGGFNKIKPKMEKALRYLSNSKDKALKGGVPKEIRDGVSKELIELEAEMAYVVMELNPKTQLEAILILKHCEELLDMGGKLSKVLNKIGTVKSLLDAILDGDDDYLECDCPKCQAERKAKGNE